MQLSNIIRLASAGMIFLFVLGGQAFAKDVTTGKGDKTYTLPEITVTAQKREEDMQKVPVAVSVKTGHQLAEDRMYEFMDMSNRIPGLTINSSGGAGIFSFVGMRGRINGMADMDPVVTVLVDGVAYDDFFSMAALPLFDIERIEVLRGPQSTLFGLNSEGGVINIITRKPTSEPKFSFGTELGSGRHTDMSWNLRGSASGPLIDGILAGGISFSHDTKGDYIKNAYSDNRFAGSANDGFRGMLVLTPTSRFEATAVASYTKVDANNGYITVPTTTEAAQAVGQSRRKKWETSTNITGDSDVETFSSSLNLKYTADFAEFIATSAYRDTRLRYNTDLDGTAYDGHNDDYGPLNQEAKERGDFSTFTQELRIQSPTDQTTPFNWLAGFFYHHFQRDRTVLSGSHYPKMLYPYSDTKLTGNSYAFFGQGTLRLFDERLGLTLGARQEWTKRTLKDRVYLTDETPEKHDSIFLPKFGIDYRFTPDTMAYITASKGWRPSGLYDSAYFPSSKKDLEYSKETSWTYELGVKSTFLDNKLTMNAAAYLSDYKDYQDMYQVNLYETYFRNAGKAQIWGFEVEAEALLAHNLSANIGFAYTHARYKNYEDELNDFSRKKIANVPEYMLNASLTYHFTDHLYIRPEVTVVGKSYWDRENNHSQNPYAMLDMRVGYEEDSFEVYLYGKNLTNTYAFAYAGNLLGNDLMYGTPIRPLEVGVGLSVHF